MVLSLSSTQVAERSVAVAAPKATVEELPTWKSRVHGRLRLLLLVVAVIVAGGFTSNALATTYYVSSTGDDNLNSGTSSSSPWQTIGKINNTSLPSGATVKFHGGDRFNDTFLNAQNSVTYTSYGTGNAIIGGSHGAQNIYLNGVHDVTLKTLTVDSGTVTADWLNAGIGGGIGSNPSAQSYNITVDTVIVEHWYVGINVGPMDYNWTIKNSIIDSMGDSGIVINRYWDNGGTPPQTCLNCQTNDTIIDNTITNTGLLHASHPDSLAHSHGIYDNAITSTIRGNLITNFDDSGISARYRGSAIENNIIDGARPGVGPFGYFGISYFDYDDANASSTNGSIWTYNKIRNITDAGIYINKTRGGTNPSTSENFTIADNTIAADLPAGYKIEVEYTSGWLQIANNVATGTATTDIMVAGCSSPGNGLPSGGFEMNDDFYDPGSTMQWCFNGTAGSRLSNTSPPGWVQSSGEGTADTTSDPLVDPLWFTLGAGSSAINAGTSSVTGLTYTASCDGALYHYCGSAPDMGAAETLTSGTAPSNTAVPTRSWFNLAVGSTITGTA